MKWDVNMIYELVKRLTRKNQAGGISANDLFYHWNAEEAMYHADLLGRWQNRNNGKSGNNTGLVLNETILSDLAPFLISEDITVSSGFGDKPEDFIYRAALRVGDYKVDVINHGQIPAVKASVIDPPSATANTYYAVEYENSYSILPNTVTGVTLDYIAAPTGIKWGYTFDADRRQVYNPGTSIQPKWNYNTVVEITKRTLANFGVSFKDQDFLNYGRTAQATGD